MKITITIILFSILVLVGVSANVQHDLNFLYQGNSSFVFMDSPNDVDPRKCLRALGNFCGPSK